MLIATVSILGGVVLLSIGADRFVLGAAAMARNLAISPLVIGLTIVGFGTSAPELLVATVATLQGKTEIAVGNALGSNIANIGLVLGATAMVKVLDVRSETLRREYPLMLLAMALAYVLMGNGTLDRLDGVILFLGFGGAAAWIVHLGRRPRLEEPLVVEFEGALPPRGLSSVNSVFYLLGGLLLLLLSAELVVWGAVQIAEAFGVSELVIGLTIVAVGTSLPELATAIASVLRNEPDIAIGNIIGSNMFNVLPVLGLSALIQPTVLSNEVLTRDFPVMIAFTLAMGLMARSVRGHPGRINRVKGAVLLFSFCVYQWVLYESIGHAVV
ncbi:MAG: calcium/sodium antiporter [Gammaproteobacteria bacterium]